MTWWLALCGFFAAVFTVFDLRSTHVGVGMGLSEVGKVARKWGLTTLTCINVAAWLLLLIGGSLIDEPARGACALVLLLMAFFHAYRWDGNARLIEKAEARGVRRVG